MNAIVWHDTKIKPFVDKFEHKQKISQIKQLELNNCRYILILSRYFSTKQLNLIARGWENRKSDSVTFMLDAFLDSTSWTLRSTKRVGLLFSVFTLDFPMKKSISQVNLSHALPLKRWYPEKHIDRHTIAFCKIRNGIHWFIPDVRLFLKQKNVFGKLIAKKLGWGSAVSPFKSQFWAGFVSISYVTLSRQLICQTVQNHIFGQNFFICGRILNPDTPKCSAWWMW